MNNATCSCCSGCVWTEGSERHSESPQKLKLHNLFWWSKKPLRVFMALYLFIFHFLFSLVFTWGFFGGLQECFSLFSDIFLTKFPSKLNPFEVETSFWREKCVVCICWTAPPLFFIILWSEWLSKDWHMEREREKQRKKPITKSITLLSLVNIHYIVFWGWWFGCYVWFVWVCWLLGLVGYLVGIDGLELLVG